MKNIDKKWIKNIDKKLKKIKWKILTKKCDKNMYIIKEITESVEEICVAYMLYQVFTAM